MNIYISFRIGRINPYLLNKLNFYLFEINEIRTNRGRIEIENKLNKLITLHFYLYKFILIVSNSFFTFIKISI